MKRQLSEILCLDIWKLPVQRVVNSRRQTAGKMTETEERAPLEKRDRGEGAEVEGKSIIDDFFK